MALFLVMLEEFFDKLRCLISFFTWTFVNVLFIMHTTCVRNGSGLVSNYSASCPYSRCCIFQAHCSFILLSQW